jgi:hypothetical protein
MLSERQRLAVVRAIAVSSTLQSRHNRQLMSEKLGKKVFIDGLNIIITLEVALSQGTLIRCMDSVIRDLAGLRGTYRLIDKTEEAIRLIGEKLAAWKIKEAVFYLDSPVSNTGRLKAKILETLSGFPFQVTVELIYNADVLLEKSEQVITSDAIILNKCSSWINLTTEIIKENLTDVKLIDLN